MIVWVKEVTDDKFEPYILEVYQLDSYVKEVIEVEFLEYGNSMALTMRLYIRICKSVLEQQDQLLLNGKWPKTFITFCLKKMVVIFLQLLLQVHLVMWNKSKTASMHLIYQHMKH